MKHYRKRGPDGTLQEQVFRLLRTVGSFDATLIAEQLGTSRGTAASTCRELLLRGKVARVWKRRRWVMWRALPNKNAPRDMRGKPAGCRNGGYANVLAMMHARHGPSWRPRVVGATALEQAWPIPQGPECTP